jgi:GT2 family glycosyltransferase
MLSVLIVNWNTRELLKACLRSLQVHAPSEPHEVIVVDNDSGDGSAEMVRAEFPDVLLIEPGANTGYAAGNNLAFGAAEGDLLLTLNSDTEFTDDSLQRAVDAMRSHDEWGALGIKQILPDDSVQDSVRGFPGYLGIFGALTRLDKVFPGSALGSYTLPKFDYEVSGPAPQPMGTFLMFRREALEAVGDAKSPFDEAFPIFFNEVDLLWRLKKADWPTWYLAEASVRHHHGSSTKQVKKSMIWESHKSLVRCLSKHLSGPARIGLPLAAVLSYGAAFIRARGWHAGFRP